MNIFFYTACESGAAGTYLKQLLKLECLSGMIVLPEGKLFFSRVTLKLRTGDLIILFAANPLELEELLILKKELSDFRIILIVDNKMDSRIAHLLNPRFIAFQNEPMKKIEAVIQNITMRQKALGESIR